eukprot:CAMPEP_0113457182 /NCGR_PEP_ID=MMETSP0014_2-20120614/9274_1 /TAXON_ID=2857 /ORGANISM="Nitzschia sp." /LENGTH=467 /DNA_ID=CAMNT_0000348665 /DNA_START=70 /DNA_END=1469 /DNA_ORIENTATION=+ /assembly_acc=CAM_ASM_000159
MTTVQSPTSVISSTGKMTSRKNKSKNNQSIILILLLVLLFGGGSINDDSIVHPVDASSSTLSFSNARGAMNTIATTTATAPQRRITHDLGFLVGGVFKAAATSSTPSSKIAFLPCSSTSCKATTKELRKRITDTSLKLERKQFKQGIVVETALIPRGGSNYNSNNDDYYNSSGGGGGGYYDDHKNSGGDYYGSGGSGSYGGDDNSNNGNNKNGSSNNSNSRGYNNYYDDFDDGGYCGGEDEFGRNGDSGGRGGLYDDDNVDDRDRTPLSTRISSMMPNMIKTGNRQIGVPMLGIGMALTLVGMSLFFNKMLMRLGNLFFVGGVPMTLGPGRTAGYFFQPKKARATACLGSGIFLVFVGWPMLGLALEIFGLLNLFGNMFPFAMALLKQMPIIGPMLRGEFGSGGGGGGSGHGRGRRDDPYDYPYDDDGRDTSRRRDPYDDDDIYGSGDYGSRSSNDYPDDDYYGGSG